ncbi:hypothetical protein SAMN04488550_0144 [Gordonia malaquae]|uniref:Uncharacterized protein n=2 Tax=Gordonia TaxID=2053 RepID=M3UZS3_GORML|nr:hypothetical protein GM1_037_00080 [Gordonia malaquae NBRC 108250]GEE00617.1 hypothetical protein nbrc107696_10630 [Gordonia spumicola]SEB49017.1 hypothetical protein SAMN04488550_0144 [Gordonia malaquae]
MRFTKGPNRFQTIDQVPTTICRTQVYVVSPEVQVSQAWIDTSAAWPQMRAYPELVDPRTGVAYSEPTCTYPCDRAGRITVLR